MTDRKPELEACPACGAKPGAWEVYPAEGDSFARQQATALEAGRKFLAACQSAWACGEPYHRVKTMMDRADEFDAALARASVSGDQ